VPCILVRQCLQNSLRGVQQGTLSLATRSGECTEQGQQEGGLQRAMDVLIYGGFSGEAVEGDVIKVDGKVGVKDADLSFDALCVQSYF